MNASPRQNELFLSRGLFCLMIVFFACAARDLAYPAGNGNLIFAALRARGSPSGEVWDACAARGKAGPVMGLRPLRGPPCIPPEAPLRKVFNFHKTARATRLLLRELPSLAPLPQVISLRAALMP